MDYKQGEYSPSFLRATMSTTEVTTKSIVLFFILEKCPDLDTKLYGHSVYRPIHITLWE